MITASRYRSAKIPSYRFHRRTGQAVVTLQGRDHYLGPWKSVASMREYDRLITEWLAAGRPTHALAAPNSIGMEEMIAMYWRHAKTYYVKNGKLTGAIPGIRVALRWLRRAYGDTSAADFGPLILKALRAKMIEAGHSRRYINDNVDRIRRMFRWAAGEELITIDVYQALAAVPGLRKGRSAARETEPVRPVGDDAVEATLPHLPEIVADMVRIQRLTGCRPSEICAIRPCDIDRTDDVWRYTPESHKTELIIARG